MTPALFAVPGDLETPTGGYAYARHLLAEARGAGLELWHWPLPGGFPRPDKATLAETARRLSAAPGDWPILIDGLALGAIPVEILAGLDHPIIALCHHPLALETGQDKSAATRLRQSERAALAQAAAVITTSAATADLLVRDYAVPHLRITVAPPGTAPAPRAAGSGGGTPHLLSVGSLTPRKGHHLLIEALARHRDLDWRLSIVGPNDRDPVCAEALARQIATLGLESRVNLVGAVGDAALAAAYNSADLFVLASLFEGFGMVYAEALAHGLPVIGSDTPAIAEATAGAAHLVPPGDVDALSAALERYISDPLARQALSALSWQAAAGLTRWEETARRIAEAIGSAAYPRLQGVGR